MLPETRRSQPESWLYFNVKVIIRLLNGLVIKQFHQVMTCKEMDKITTNDVWNDGKTYSVNIYVDGQHYCSWKLSRGERPMAI